MKVVKFGAMAMTMAMAWGLAACGIEGPSQEAMTSSELGAGAYLMSPRKGRVIGRAADLDGPNGVFVGPDGNLYVANLFGDEITVHNPHSGAILDRIGPERGVHGPDDVVVADDGTIYWTEFLAGNVGMLKPNGEYRTQFVGPGVNPITISDDGRLFVARDFAGQGLYELDPQLLAPPEVLIADLANFNGMDFGPDGLLYGPLVFDGTIVRIDVDASNPSPVVVASGFTRPAAVKFNSAGELYAVDVAEGQVAKVDPNTGTIQILVDGAGYLDNLAFDAEDHLFVSSFEDGQILKLAPSEKLHPLNPAGFIAPSGVSADASGNIWVADISLRGFDHGLKPHTSFLFRLLDPFQGIGVTNTVFSHEDVLLTTGWFSNAVQVVDPSSGAILEDWRTFAVPTNAIYHGPELVVAQLGAGNVVNGGGDVVLGGLAVPLGLASDGQVLYVSDWATGKIWAVSQAGSTVIAEGLASPEGLALSGGQLLIVEEGADQVIALDLASGDRVPVITGLTLGDRVVPGAVPYGNFNGIAVDGAGKIYVSDDGANSVYWFPALP